MKISVIIPTFKRPFMLDRCLKSLARQSLSQCEFEVIVVDDEPNECTRKLAERFRLEHPHFNLRYIAMKVSKGPATARNVGWKAAKSPVIAFTDDDCIVSHLWLENGLKAFTERVAAVSGRIRVPLPERPTDYQRTISWLEKSQFATANCFYKKNVLEATGGFDERFKTAWREDADLFFTLLSKGYKTIYWAEAVVTHPIKRAGWGISLREQKKSFFDALLYKKHKRLYRKLIGLPPWRYYVILSGYLMSGIGCLRCSPSLFLGGLTLSGVFILLFFHKRIQGNSLAPFHIAEMALTSFLVPVLSIYWRLLGAFKFRTWFI